MAIKKKIKKIREAKSSTASMKDSEETKSNEMQLDERISGELVKLY